MVGEKGIVLIKPIKIEDDLTGLVLEVAIEPHYGIIAVGSRCFYFNRKTGEYDGAATRVGNKIEQAGHRGGGAGLSRLRLPSSRNCKS